MPERKSCAREFSTLKQYMHNRNKGVDRSIDWPKFRDNAIVLHDSFGSKYYIKEDLRKAV